MWVETRIPRPRCYVLIRIGTIGSWLSERHICCRIRSVWGARKRFGLCNQLCNHTTVVSLFECISKYIALTTWRRAVSRIEGESSDVFAGLCGMVCIWIGKKLYISVWLSYGRQLFYNFNLFFINMIRISISTIFEIFFDIRSTS